MQREDAVRAAMPVVRWAARFLVSTAMVAAVTAALVFLRHVSGGLSLPAPYLLVVVPVAVFWGARFAVIVALLSVTTFAYMFIPPFRSFQIAGAGDTVALSVFLATAIVMGELASRMHKAALASNRMSQEQSALRRVATLVAQSASSSAVCEAVIREVGLLCGADLARMERYEPDGTVTTVATWGHRPSHQAVGTRFPLDGRSIAADVRRTGEPVRIESYRGEPGAIAQEARDLGIGSSVGCPIQVGGRLWGVISASTRTDRAFPVDTESKIASFTELVTTAIENAEARTELSASRARIVATADQTRRRIEHDLHNGAQQRLVSAALQLRAAQAAVPPELIGLGAQLDETAASLSEAIEQLRAIARGIHPAVLGQGGLAPALKGLARRSPIPVSLTVEVPSGLPEPVEISAYHVVAETLTNAAKHANAAAITVTAETTQSTLHLTVRDDGRGGANFRPGGGLISLKDRVEALSGRMYLDSPRGAGTTVGVELPLPPDRQQRSDGAGITTPGEAR